MTHESSQSGLQLGAIRVSGPDALEFLHAQFTADLHELKPGVLTPAAWCKPDGRAEFTMLAARDDGGVLLVVPAERLEALGGKLRMFSIGRRIDISPPRPMRPDAGHGYPLAFDASRGLAECDNDFIELPDEWLAADAECGMPWLTDATAGRFLPQMLDLDALGGLSWRKGCYPGQEVVARVHYRGRLTRRTACFRLEAGALPAPGTEFEIGDGTGHVLYAAPGSDGVIGLAVIPTGTEPGCDGRIQRRTVLLFSH